MYNSLIKPMEKISVGSCRHILEDNIEVSVIEMENEGVA